MMRFDSVKLARMICFFCTMLLLSACDEPADAEVDVCDPLVLDDVTVVCGESGYGPVSATVDCDGMWTVVTPESTIYSFDCFAIDYL